MLVLIFFCSVHHLLVCNCRCFSDQHSLLSTTPSVWESLDYTKLAPSVWQRGSHIQINGNVTPSKLLEGGGVSEFQSFSEEKKNCLFMPLLTHLSLSSSPISVPKRNFLFASLQPAIILRFFSPNSLLGYALVKDSLEKASKTPVR